MYTRTILYVCMYVYINININICIYIDTHTHTLQGSGDDVSFLSEAQGPEHSSEVVSSTASLRASGLDLGVWGWGVEFGAQESWG